MKPSFTFWATFLKLKAVFLSGAGAPSSCWGRSRRGTTRSASRWSCGWAAASPRCRRCASPPPSEAAGEQRVSGDLLTGRRAKPHTYLSRSEGLESSDGDLVVGADSVVVWRVGEREGQQALLLQVRFWNRRRFRGKCSHRDGNPLLNSAVPWILAKLLTMMALPPRCRGSSAACSLLEPSP